MPLKTYILLVVLFCLISLCIVSENTRYTEMRYRIVQLESREQRLRTKHMELRRRYTALIDPVRLERLNQEMGLKLEPLSPVSSREVARR